MAQINKKRAESKLLNRVAHYLARRTLVKRWPLGPGRDKQLALVEQTLTSLSDQYYELTGHRIPTEETGA